MFVSREQYDPRLSLGLVFHNGNSFSVLDALGALGASPTTRQIKGKTRAWRPGFLVHPPGLEPGTH